MRRNTLRCTAAVCIAAILLCGLPHGSLFAQGSAPAQNAGFESEYTAYLTAGGAADAADDLPVPLTPQSDGAAVETGADGLYWRDGRGSLTFTVEAPAAALYRIELVWQPAGSGVNPQLGLMIDGAYPFSDAEEITLQREWKNASSEPRTDAQGNEYAQEQVETGTDIVTLLSDVSGVVTEPYRFYLPAGSHTLTLVGPGQGIYIRSLTLKAPVQPPLYSELSAGYDLTPLDTPIVVLEGEDAAVKSSKALIPRSNNSDAGMTPSDARLTKINYIGGTSWQSPGSRLTWKFNIEKAGYYAVNLRYKQSDLVNGDSLRRLEIDGVTPFAEAETVRFPYGVSWKQMTVGIDGESCYLYFTPGEHTLSLTATMGSGSEYFYRLNSIVEALGDQYIKIVMITGESPDPNRDYSLFQQIPDFNSSLTDCRDGLLQLAADMKDASGRDSTQAIAAMENMARVLGNMLRSPYYAQQYVSDYYTNYTSLSSWLYDMANMPLSLDRIQLVPVGSEPADTSAGIFKRIAYSAMRLLSSFTESYSISGSGEEGNGKSLRLWVNWGQDQAAVLNSFIEDSFTPQTGIKVQLEIVNASLVNGLLAGNFPDLSLQMARTEPVNLGIRGALYDLRQFDDCDTVLENFQPGAAEPYSYGGKLYALPDTQSFYLMFYRTDVFERLGLTAPETWTEFLHTATIIQRNNMSVYVPYTQITTSTTVNVGLGSLHLYPTLMAQHGLSLYNADRTAAALDSKAAIDVFEQWTDLYTDYKFYKEADFYNRFRVGVMPLGIAPYNTYMTLYSAAPEIRGRWKIAPVPGTPGTDGQVNHAVAGAGTGCAIIQKSSRKEEAWEFLKWWTSAETQTRYSDNVESILGTIGRIQTANVRALENLAWNTEDLEVLMAQWALVEELPEIPGSYYLTRSIDQAYWAVVNGESSVKDAVVKRNREANEEIDRKIKEYG